MDLILDYICEYFLYIVLISILINNYIKLDTKYYMSRAINIWFIIDTFFSAINFLCEVDYSIYYCVQSFFLLFFLYCKCFSYIKSDEINDENVCLIFYKPKKLKQFLYSMAGLSYSSAGLVINKNIYQMRYEAETLQEIPFKEETREYLKERYLIIDTGFKWQDLKGDWRSNLLSQSARQKKTWNLRFNCLRSLRFVLNQIPGYEYKNEIICPCMYLYELKINRLFGDGRK